MTKQEQEQIEAIHKMAQIALGKQITLSCTEYAIKEGFFDNFIALYNAGYRKLPEDSIVLSREEYEMLATQYKNLEIKYSNLSDNYRLCKDANETLKQSVITAHKETAKEILNRINEYNLNYNWDLKEEFIKLCKDYDVEVEDD